MRKEATEKNHWRLNSSMIGLPLSKISHGLGNLNGDCHSFVGIRTGCGPAVSTLPIQEKGYGKELREKEWREVVLLENYRP